MIRPALLVAALLIASGCAPPGAANAPAPTTEMLDTRGAEEPRLVEAFSAICASLDVGMIAAAATSRRFGFATAPAREALGARTATAVWVRGDSTFPDIVSWRQEDGVCEVLGRAESQDQVFRAFLRYLAPQRAVYQTFDRPALNRFAFVQLDAAVVHSLGSGASRFRGYPAVLLSRRQAPSAPLR